MNDDTIHAALTEVSSGLTSRRHPFTKETRTFLARLAGGEHVDATINVANTTSHHPVSYMFANPTDRRTLQITAGVLCAFSDAIATRKLEHIYQIAYEIAWCAVETVQHTVVALLAHPAGWNVAVEGCALAGVDAHEYAVTGGLDLAAKAVQAGARRAFLDEQAPAVEEHAELFAPHPAMFSTTDDATAIFAARLLKRSGIPSGATVEWLGGLDAGIVAAVLGLSGTATEILDKIAPEMPNASLNELAEAVAAIADGNSERR